MTRQAYTTLLLDLDLTLLDSETSEVAAFAATVRSVGLEPTADLYDRYRSINGELWAAVERGETTPVELRLTRFERFVTAVGIDGDPEAMATTFTDGLAANGDLYPGARAVLDRLLGRFSIALVTNGLSEVQRVRIERLDLGRYLDAVVISGEVGVSKPGSDIFDIAFDRLGRPDRRSTLMVGDSLSSDIQGGFDYGIDTCWYNPAGAVPGAASPAPTHTIAALDELLAVAGPGRAGPAPP